MKRAIIVLILGGALFFLGGCSLLQKKGPTLENWEPTLSQDNKTIAYASPGEKGFELFTRNLDTGEITQLTHNEVDDWAPRWSPKGDKIVFSSNRDKNVDLYIIDLSTLTETRLTTHDGEDINPYWTANDRILFNSNRTDKWQMYMIDPDGNNLTQISEPASTE